MKTVLGLFGPPRAGKNTVISLMRSIAEWYPLSISDEIKRYSHEITGRVFEDHEKDVPQESLNGRTPRDLYIYIGQLDEFRHDLWAGPVADIIYNMDNYQRFVIESVGKNFQWQATLNRRPCRRMLLCEVHQEGRSYDTRGPIKDDDRWIFRINNPKTEDGNIEHLVPQVYELLKWVEEQEPRW